MTIQINTLHCLLCCTRCFHSDWYQCRGEMLKPDHSNGALLSCNTVRYVVQNGCNFWTMDWILRCDQLNESSSSENQVRQWAEDSFSAPGSPRMMKAFQWVLLFYPSGTVNYDVRMFSNFWIHRWQSGSGGVMKATELWKCLCHWGTLTIASFSQNEVTKLFWSMGSRKLSLFS